MQAASVGEKRGNGVLAVIKAALVVQNLGDGGKTVMRRAQQRCPGSWQKPIPIVPKPHKPRWPWILPSPVDWGTTPPGKR